MYLIGAGRYYAMEISLVERWWSVVSSLRGWNMNTDHGRRYLIAGLMH